MNNLTAMAVFAKVVETRSFSKAADELRLSKSTVSKAVSGLEDRFGARLLNRTTRRLSLTEAGMAFYDRCSRMVAEAAAAEESISELSAGPRGTLRVTAPLSFGFLHLAPLVPAFLESYPHIDLDMNLTDEFVDVVEGGFDLAVRVGRLVDSRLMARKLAPCRFAVCGAPAYFERHGAPQSPRDLSRHFCMRYSHLATQDEWHFEGPEGRVSVRIGGRFRSDNGDALRAAALEGLGLLYTPTFIVGDDLRAGRLVEVLSDYLWETGVYAVYPSGRYVPAKLRVFVDFLVKRFGPAPYWDDGL